MKWIEISRVLIETAFIIFTMAIEGSLSIFIQYFKRHCKNILYLFAREQWPLSSMKEKRKKTYAILACVAWLW